MGLSKTNRMGWVRGNGAVWEEMGLGRGFKGVQGIKLRLGLCLFDKGI